MARINLYHAGAGVPCANGEIYTGHWALSLVCVSFFGFGFVLLFGVFLSLGVSWIAGVQKVHLLRRHEM